jgi:hypothetical protein
MNWHSLLSVVPTAIIVVAALVAQMRQFKRADLRSFRGPQPPIAGLRKVSAVREHHLMEQPTKSSSRAPRMGDVWGIVCFALLIGTVMYAVYVSL